MAACSTSPDVADLQPESPSTVILNFCDLDDDLKHLNNVLSVSSTSSPLPSSSSSTSTVPLLADNRDQTTTLNRNHDDDDAIDLFRLSICLGRLCLGDSSGREVVEARFDQVQTAFCQRMLSREVAFHAVGEGGEGGGATEEVEKGEKGMATVAMANSDEIIAFERFVAGFRDFFLPLLTTEEERQQVEADFQARKRLFAVSKFEGDCHFVEQMFPLFTSPVFGYHLCFSCMSITTLFAIMYVAFLHHCREHFPYHPLLRSCCAFRPCVSLGHAWFAYITPTHTIHYDIGDQMQPLSRYTSATITHSDLLRRKRNATSSVCVSIPVYAGILVENTLQIMVDKLRAEVQDIKYVQKVLGILALIAKEERFDLRLSSLRLWTLSAYKRLYQQLCAIVKTMCPTQEAENASLAMYCFKLAVSMSPQNYRARMCGIRCLADESSDIDLVEKELRDVRRFLNDEEKDSLARLIHYISSREERQYEEEDIRSMFARYQREAARAECTLLLAKWKGAATEEQRTRVSDVLLKKLAEEAVYEQRVESVSPTHDPSREEYQADFTLKEKAKGDFDFICDHALQLRHFFKAVQEASGAAFDADRQPPQSKFWFYMMSYPYLQDLLVEAHAVEVKRPEWAEQEHEAAKQLDAEHKCYGSKARDVMQNIFVCVTCCYSASKGWQRDAALCANCATLCHRRLAHDIVNIGKKSGFSCDCNRSLPVACMIGDEQAPAKDYGCAFQPKPNCARPTTRTTSNNGYNHNFRLQYCYRTNNRCKHKNEDVGTAMRQCNDCQDWFHDECVGSDTDADTEEGFRCDDCKASNKRVREDQIKDNGANSAGDIKRLKESTG